MFQDAEKKAREQRKWEREAGARAAQQAKEEAEKKKAEEERLAKESQQAGKKAKEAAKNAKKKLKRTVRAGPKEVSYFGEADSKVQESIDADVDAILEKLNDTQLADLAGKVSDNKDAAAVKAAYVATAAELKLSSVKYFSS